MMVKICGITTLEDAEAAAEAGASALGYIFFAKSPRYIKPEQARKLIDSVRSSHPNILHVGVFVDELPRLVQQSAKLAGIDIVQFHGKETPARIPSALRSWKAFRITPDWSSEALKAFRTEAFLLDSPSQGQTFDWSYAAGLSQRIILAGGLDASNVRPAIEAVKPWGVDASSRLELVPGKKDHRKVYEFVQEARSACI